MRSPTYATMDEALLGILGMLLHEGEPVAPRGAATRELLGFTFRLTNPRARRIALPARQWKESLAVGELCWHLSQSDLVDVISYYTPTWARFSDDGKRISSSCYGRRIFGGPISQWERARETLKNDAATRRAVLTLVDPSADAIGAKDVSCITSIQFLVRNGALDAITTMRSCDVIWGLCYDVYFCTMLQELMAVELGVELGTYHHFAGSLHLYEAFEERAAQIVREGLAGQAEPMMPLEAPESLPQFLAAEAALREDRDEGDAQIQSLPTYWRSLAAPLIRLRRRRHGQEAIPG
ncbi:MAG: thymidylate synthase [Gemmatimonadetes bacterium]|nr:thymidylate synthase [Gemmatimonadota bacterium]